MSDISRMDEAARIIDQHWSSNPRREEGSDILPNRRVYEGMAGATADQVVYQEVIARELLPEIEAGINADKTENNSLSQYPSEWTPRDFGLVEKGVLSLTDLKKAEREYNDEINRKSAGGEVPRTDVGVWRKISRSEYEATKDDFARNKPEHIRKWEEKNGIPWPRYETDVYGKDGETVVRRKGDAYDAHHIQPVEFGGSNSPENLTPVHYDDHSDKQGLHRPGGPYDQLANHFRNV
jgi:hypothetical protein